jgi:hypothetical protein
MLMAQSIKISDEEMELLRREARLASRSIAGQVTHWLRIGRSIERAPDFNYAHIREALHAGRSPDALTSEEQAVYVDELMDIAAAETPEQSEFYASRRKAGLGVGADKAGKIVKQKKPGRA